jgi:hypothetical protein
VALVIIQVLPIGRVKNPPVTQEAPWPSQEARSIAVAACYDCHSNQVQLQWYDKIAPVSWYVTNHVNEGRGAVNFSEWDRPQESDDLAESVEEGGMPLQSYTLLHAGGRLSDAEKRTLVDALQQLGEGGGGEGRGSSEDGEG